MEGYPLNYKVILITWLKRANSYCETLSRLWPLIAHISESTLCIYSLHRPGLSHLTCFDPWCVSKCYTGIDFRSALSIESCPLLLLGPPPLACWREGYTPSPSQVPRRLHLRG